MAVASAVLLAASSCGLGRADPQEEIRGAVAATIAALPTYTPYPPPLNPTPAPPDLIGLFCEYRFCIGHPPDVSFFDVSAQRNPTDASSFSRGILAGYTSNVFIQLMWQEAPGVGDPQFMLDLILFGDVDSRSGNLNPQLIGDLNVLYVPISSSASTQLPSGGAAIWMCGGRAFAWKTYTAQPETAQSLLIDALRKFRCSS
jgi:hypothetical protein